jgi:GT2 family glycosyltransferase
VISLIITIKNQASIVNYCLKSISQHFRDEEVVLVDDGSDEKTKKLTEGYTEKYNWILIRNDKSVGHTQACTQGIQKSTAENIFLLNSDIIVTKNSLSELAKVMDENKDIAVVGPCTSSASGKQLISRLYQRRFVMRLGEIEQIANQVANNVGFEDIPTVNGFCFGMKRSVFNEVGGFDPVLTCYGNEKELSVRIRKAGYRTVWVKHVYVHHFGKVTYSKENINIGRACIDADRYILKKHGG